MRAYTDGEIYGEKNIKKKYKKWVNANILYDKKIIKTKIRILGDWKDFKTSSNKFKSKSKR